MDLNWRFSKNILGELQSAIIKNKPDISSERGNLFILKSLPIGALRLKVPLEDYLRYIDSLDVSLKPRPAHIFPHKGKNFQIIVNAAVECKEGKTFIDGKEVKLI